MNFNTIQRIVIVAWTLCLIGCGGEPRKTTTKYTGITRVFMHTKYYVTVFVPQEDGKIKQISLYGNRTGTISDEDGVQFVQDVPPGESMWAETTDHFDGWSSWTETTVHIHSVNDVEGGSWNNGKHGSGTTNVVE